MYYKSKKSSHLLLRNSPTVKKEPTQQSHVVYKFICTRGKCEALPSTYIGMTTMKLSRRLSYHLTSGAPKNHLRQEHQATLTREMLVENTNIITSCSDTRRFPSWKPFILKTLNRILTSSRQTFKPSPAWEEPRIIQKCQTKPHSLLARGEFLWPARTNQRRVLREHTRRAHSESPAPCLKLTCSAHTLHYDLYHRDDNNTPLKKSQCDSKSRSGSYGFLRRNHLYSWEWR